MRGCTLRFLCKIKEVEILEPLNAAVLQCLDHKHPYVRRNAILAVNSIYRSVDYLMPDAPEMIYEKFIASGQEADPLCLRNAMAMLSVCQPDLITEYLKERHGVISVFDAEVQLVCLEHVRRYMTSESADICFDIYRQLLKSITPSVKYEAAISVLHALHNNPDSHIIAGEVLRALVSLASATDSDDNVKLIALENICNLQENFPDVMEDEAALLDILRTLSSSDLKVRKKALGVVIRGVSGARGEDVLSQLKRELSKLSVTDSSQNPYRSLLLDSVNELNSRFSDLSSSSLSLFMSYLTMGCDYYTDQVTQFVKDIMERSPSLQSQALQDILNTLVSPSSGDKAMEVRRVIGSIWIAGEFADSADQIEQVVSTFEKSIGGIPLLQQELSAEQQRNNDEGVQLQPQTDGTRTKVRVLADGTYASETAMSSVPLKVDNEPVVKVLLKGGFFEVGAVMSITLAKLICRQKNPTNQLKARAMLLMTGMVRFGLSRFPARSIDRDSYDRIMFTLRSLNTPTTVAHLKIMFKECREAFERRQKVTSPSTIVLQTKTTQVDSPIQFTILSSNDKQHDHGFVSDLEEAINGTSTSSSLPSSNLLSRVVQLTGFSDALYAETYVTMHQSDIFLDILVVNQLDEQLNDVSLDLSVSGDLKVVDNPPSCSFSPMSFATLKAVVKVCSTCNGAINGSINYLMAGEEQSVVLLPINVDVLDFVKPESISDSEFRSQWTLLEWENKINVDVAARSFSSCASLFSFLAEKMKLAVTGQPPPAEAAYLAGNLFAKTIFGEEVLVNVCLERGGDDKVAHISGHLRLRSRSQGVAVALGDRILSTLKPFKP